MKQSAFRGCRHSSVDLSVPTILPPWVRVQSTPSTLLSFVVFVLFLPCEKDENKPKEAGFGPLKKEPVIYYFCNIWPFTTMKFCLIPLEICQSELKTYPITKLTLKMFPNTCKILPKWRNFAKSCHTVTNHVYFIASCSCVLVEKFTHWPSNQGTVPQNLFTCN